MTPRVGEAKSSSTSLSSGKVRPGDVKDYGDADDPNAKRRKKKLYYAKLRQQEEERQKELAAKYRDRATERREGKNVDYQHNDAPDLAKTAEYRAVAPTADQVNTAAERRRLAIQENGTSKQRMSTTITWRTKLPCQKLHSSLVSRCMRDVRHARNLVPRCQRNKN